MNRIATRKAVTEATELLVLEYLLNGGEIKVAKAGPKTNTFPMIRGSVTHKGAKAMTLRAKGLYLR